MPVHPSVKRRGTTLTALALTASLVMLPQVARALAIDRTYELEGGTIAKYPDDGFLSFDYFLSVVVDPEIKGELTLHRVEVAAPTENVSQNTLFDFELYFDGEPLKSPLGRPPGQRTRMVGGEFPDAFEPYPTGHRYTKPAQLRWVHNSLVAGEVGYFFDANFQSEEFQIGPDFEFNRVKGVAPGPVDTNTKGLGLHTQLLGWTGLTGTRVNVEKVTVRIVGELDNYQIFPNPNLGTIEIAADDTAYNAEEFLNTGSIAVAGSFENRQAGPLRLLNDGSISVLSGGEFVNSGNLDMPGWLDVASGGTLHNKGDLKLVSATADLQVAAGASFLNERLLYLSAAGASFTVRGALTNEGTIYNEEGKIVFAGGSTAHFKAFGSLYNDDILENRSTLVLDVATSLTNVDTAVNFAGGRIEVNGRMSNSGDGAFLNDGDLIVGAGGALGNNATLLNQGLVSTGLGSFVDNQGQLTNEGQILVRGNFSQSGSGRLVNTADGNLRFDAMEGFVAAPPDLGVAGDIENLGLIELAGGARLQSAAYFDNHGRFVIEAGTRFDNLDFFLNRGLLEVAGLFDNYFGELLGDGTIKLANGTVKTGMLSLEGGSLAGNGKIEGNLTVKAGAKLAPGNSPGRIDIEGDLIVDGGELVIETAGRAGQDVLTVTGDVQLLGGSVNFVALPGYTPEFDDSWDWLHHEGTVSTGFDQLTVTYTGLPDSWAAFNSARPDGRASVYLLPQDAAPLEVWLGSGNYMQAWLDHGQRHVNAENFYLGAGSLSIREGAEFVNEGYLTNSGFLVNRGRLAQAPGATFFNGSRFRNVAGGMVEGDPGSIIYNAGAFEIEAGSSVTTGFFGQESWAFNAATRVDGTLTVETLQILGGSLGGHGTLAVDAGPVEFWQLAEVSLVKDAVVQPGGSIGTLRIDGSIALDAVVLEIEIGSLTDFDQLEVTGDLVFNPARIDYLFVDGFLPAGGRIDWLRVDGNIYGSTDPSLVSYFWTVAADGTRSAYASGHSRPRLTGTSSGT